MPRRSDHNTITAAFNDIRRERDSLRRERDQLRDECETLRNALTRVERELEQNQSGRIRQCQVVNS